MCLPRPAILFLAAGIPRFTALVLTLKTSASRVMKKWCWTSVSSGLALPGPGEWSQRPGLALDSGAKHDLWANADFRTLSVA